MIIRKPFAFLVEKFKLLHFIILIPCIYLVYMFWRLSEFFNTFVSSGYVTTIADVPGKYYSFLMIIALILIILFTGLVALLFKKKNKFYLPYVIITIGYIIILAITIILPSVLHNAEVETLESSTSLIFRGIMSIAFYMQIVFNLAIILLSFGFDIRTGEFLDIKEEINLDENDSEEIEINVKSDDYKVKRFLRRYSREIKYYIIENKNIFKVMAAVLVIRIIFLIVKFFCTMYRKV